MTSYSVIEILFPWLVLLIIIISKNFIFLDSATSDVNIELKQSYNNSSIHQTDTRKVNNKRFSGLYRPNTEVSEAFSGAFLTHKNRFLNKNSLMRLNRIRMRGIELAIFAFYFEGINVMTRDYFDFQVIHLSSTTNQAPHISDDTVLQNELLSRMRNTVEMLVNNNKKLQ